MGKSKQELDEEIEKLVKQRNDLSLEESKEKDLRTEQELRDRYCGHAYFRISKRQGIKYFNIVRYKDFLVGKFKSIPWQKDKYASIKSSYEINHLSERIHLSLDDDGRFSMSIDLHSSSGNNFEYELEICKKTISLEEFEKIKSGYRHSAGSLMQAYKDFSKVDVKVQIEETNSEYKERTALEETEILADYPHLILNDDEKYAVGISVFHPSSYIYLVTKNSLAALEKLYRKALTDEMDAALFCASMGERWRGTYRSKELEVLIKRARNVLKDEET